MEIIRQARKAAGLTQEQLAAMLGMTQGAIAQWENGLTHPSYSVLKPLAAALGLTLDQLLEGSDGKLPDNRASCGKACG